MFYSETLLAKTGPLARVWLASNLERKLTKQTVLTSNLENNVRDIIGEGQAPMALRLSSQLLLGVVKIYSRKAKYLLDDCNEAWNKIRIFKRGDVDLPSHSHAANPSALILPDAVTELDLFAPLPDPADLLRDDFDMSRSRRDPTLLDNGASQLLPDDEPTPRRKRRTLGLDDMDVALDGLDFGLDPAEQTVRSPAASEDRSIEMGRRAHTPRRDEPSLLEADDLGLDFGEDIDTTIGAGMASVHDDVPMLDADDGFQIHDDLNDDLAAQNQAALDNARQAAERRQRDSESPLSELRPSEERDLEDFHTLQIQVDDSTMVQAPQRNKRRKIMQQDKEIQLHTSQIKRLQEDRSAITKAPTFLPRDPVLLQLMEMQRNGSFVSNIMGNGRMEGWAPELRAILSLEVVRKAGEKKRKRDSGVADLETDEDNLEAGSRQATPHLDIPQSEHDITAGAHDFNPLMSDGPAPQQPEEEEQGYIASPPQEEVADIPFDITEAPLLHPSQAGPVSLSTKSAVQLLRSHFAPDHPRNATEPPTPSKRVKADALFTDLCPEDRTTRGDATKMFFELLVLGTKDAVKVEQDEKVLGGPIRVRGKRGLWGSWAEDGTQAPNQDQGSGEEWVVVEQPVEA